MVFEQMDEVLNPLGDGDLPLLEYGPCQGSEPPSAGFAFPSLEFRLLLLSFPDDVLAPAVGAGFRLQRVDEIGLVSAGTTVLGGIPEVERLGDHAREKGFSIE